jgi:hypothetical protein
VLPDHLSVSGSLYLGGTGITVLSDHLNVGGEVYGFEAATTLARPAAARQKPEAPARTLKARALALLHIS